MKHAKLLVYATLIFTLPIGMAVAQESTKSTADFLIVFRQDDNSSLLVQKLCDEYYLSKNQAIMLMLPYLPEQKQCPALMIPLVKKYINQYADTLPKRITREQAESFGASVGTASSSEYRKLYSKVPKKIYLNQVELLFPQRACSEMFNIPKLKSAIQNMTIETCITRVKPILLNCIADNEQGIPDEADYVTLEKYGAFLGECTTVKFYDTYKRVATPQ